MGHIWLIGMMGSGKTTVGLAVADELGLKFIDSDDAVVEVSGRSIEDLFAESERAFREVEHEVIARIAKTQGRVVATGGGAVLDASNVVAMKATGTMVLLNADTQTLRDRLSGTTTRPLLIGGADIGTIAQDRAALYRTAADVVIDTEEKSIDEVVSEVVTCART